MTNRRSTARSACNNYVRFLRLYSSSRRSGDAAAACCSRWSHCNAEDGRRLRRSMLSIICTGYAAPAHDSDVDLRSTDIWRPVDESLRYAAGRHIFKTFELGLTVTDLCSYNLLTTTGCSYRVATHPSGTGGNFPGTSRNPDALSRFPGELVPGHPMSRISALG
jgi:hypothetical protein